MDLLSIKNDFLNLPKNRFKRSSKKLWLLLRQVISSLMVVITLFTFSLTFPLCLPLPRKPNHPFSKITALIGFDLMAIAKCGLSIYFLLVFWKKVALLCYVVSEKFRAFSIWFCVGHRSAARLMGVTITCITLFWPDSFCFNIVKYVSGVCFLV